jgi:diguanylate cyclase (GGDEF)-like protein
MRVSVRYQLGDASGASRSVAYLMMAGGPLNFLTGVVLVPEQASPSNAIAFTLLCVGLTACGAICRWRPEWVPHVSWLIAPFFATALITGLNYATRDASTGAQLFYLWPILYVANFLSRTVIITVLALVSAGNAVVVLTVLGSDKGVTDWVSLTVALALTVLVVTSLRSRNDRLREVLETQALADPLTGVANRRSFDGELTRAVAWANRTGGSIALLTLDVDLFKQINDTWGHAVGDRALQHVATTLRSVARRADDVVARLGGDEFVVLLRADRSSARRTADEIRAAVAATTDLPCGSPGLSIGVAAMPDHAATADELVAASDSALYVAKSAGRGRTSMAGPAESTPGSGGSAGRSDPHTAAAS